MASWEFSSIGIECEKEKEKLVLQLMDCLDYCQVTGDGFNELYSRAGSMMFYAYENDGILWFYGGNSDFTEDRNPIDDARYYGKSDLTILFNILRYTFGNVSLYYQYEEGNTVTDYYVRIEELFKPDHPNGHMEVAVCNYCKGTNEVFGRTPPQDKVNEGMTIDALGKTRFEKDVLHSDFSDLGTYFITLKFKSEEKGYSELESVLSLAGEEVYSRIKSELNNMRNITIPKGTEIISQGEFWGKDFLSITITEGVKTIEGYAFGECSDLQTIRIPDSVTEIGDGAFKTCTSLISITIPNSVTKICRYTFSNCESLSSFTIPNSVTEIEEGAFSGCTNLNSINIPDSVTVIGNWAFEDCTSLTSVTIPDSVTEIGEDAFGGCTSLSEINLGPNSNFVISDGALWTKDMQTKIVELAK